MASALRQRLEKLLPPAHLKLGLRACVAALVTFAITSILHIPNGYWAVLTAVLVVQATVGASLAVATERAMGTLVGGIVGVASAIIAGPSLSLTYITLVTGILITSTLAARSSAFKLAPVTVIIVLLAEPSHANPLVSALYRLLEIGIGGLIGVLCAMLILPARALFVLFPHCAEAVRNCARLMALGRDGLIGRPWFPETVDALNASTRKNLRAADARAGEARTEQRWSSEVDPAPVVRSCRRLWHSVIILLRNADHPLPDLLATRIAPDLDAAVTALSRHMETISARLDGTLPSPDGEDTALAARIAVSALEARTDQLKTAGTLDAASGVDLTALFGAISACVQVRDNLADLDLRLVELHLRDRVPEPSEAGGASL